MYRKHYSLYTILQVILLKRYFISKVHKTQELFNPVSFSEARHNNYGYSSKQRDKKEYMVKLALRRNLETYIELLHIFNVKRGLLLYST